MFNGEIMIHLKRILKRLYYYKREQHDANSCGIQDCKNVDGHFYHASNILLRDTKYQARNVLCSNTRIEKKRIEGLYFREG